MNHNPPPGHTAHQTNRFCPNCGEALPAWSQFCGTCGERLSPQNATQVLPQDDFAAPQEPFAPPPIPDYPTPPQPSPYLPPAVTREKKQGYLPWIIAGAAVGLGLAACMAVLLAVRVLGTSDLFSTSGEPISQQEPAPGTGLFPTRPKDVATRTAAAPAPAPTRTAPPPLTRPAALPSPTPLIIDLAPTRPPRPTATAKPCPGAPPQRLEINEDAKVCTKSDYVFLRSGPAKSYSTLKKVYPGTVVTVIDGPRCSDNWSWWKVKLSGGTTGWMAEGGDKVDPYFLCPN